MNKEHHNENKNDEEDILTLAKRKQSCGAMVRHI